jgi:hypothetical protein
MQLPWEWNCPSKLMWFVFFLFGFSIYPQDFFEQPIFETKISNITGFPSNQKKLEASGIYKLNDFYYLVFDNISAMVSFNTSFDKKTVKWISTNPSSGFEGITFHKKKNSLLIIEEASLEKEPKAYIHEYNLGTNYLSNPVLVPFPLVDRKGFEGIAYFDFQGQDYLALLLEKKKYLHPTSGKKGNLFILKQENSGKWSEYSFESLKKIGFKDYSDIAIFQNKVAIVSQKSSSVWIGDWNFPNLDFSHGKVYHFPLINQKGEHNPKGEKGYCNVEGVTWVDSNTLAFVSDRQKKTKRKTICSFKEEMIHIFRIPK